MRPSSQTQVFGGQLGWRTGPYLGVRGAGSHHTLTASNGEGEDGPAGYQGHSNAQRNTGVSPSRTQRGACTEPGRWEAFRHNPLDCVQTRLVGGPDVAPEGGQFATLCWPTYSLYSWGN